MITWQWLAGFFDGEGCICISKYPHQLHISIQQKYREILDKIKNFLGYGCVYKHADIYSFAFVSNNAADFLKKVLPYLKIKVLQAKLGIQFDKHRHKHVRRGITGCMSEKEKRWRNMHYELMKLYKCIDRG